MRGANDSAIHALVPVKTLDQAKSRLRPFLSPAERQQLVLAMVRDVIHVLSTTPQIAHISLVSGDPAIGQLAQVLAVRWINDGADLNLALQRTSDQARRNRQQPLILFADVPMVTGTDITTLLTAAVSHDLVLGASHDGGTNGMFGAAIPLAFGSGSFERHQQAASESGLQVAIVRLPGLERDIDVPADVVWLARQPGQRLSQQFARSLDLNTRLKTLCGTACSEIVV